MQSRVSAKSQEQAAILTVLHVVKSWSCQAAGLCVPRYKERLVISKRVRIVADGSGPVTLAWSTDAPYQSAIESQGLHGASVSGLTIRHRSPSVANNYAVFLQVRITRHISRPDPLNVRHSFVRRCLLPHRPELEVYYTTLL